MFVLLSPVGAYYSGGFRPITLLASTKYARAWPGGVGDTKCGGNYAPTIMPQQEALADGCDQILWLMGDDHIVTEAGVFTLPDAQRPTRRTHTDAALPCPAYGGHLFPSDVAWAVNPRPTAPSVRPCIH